MGSEFGKGLTYCIGLFLAHADRIRVDEETYSKISKKERAYPMWFYAASDHLSELVIPKQLPKDLQNRLRAFKNKCLGWRLTIKEGIEATKEDYDWAIQEAKALLQLIDRYMGVRVQKAGFE